MTHSWSHKLFFKINQQIGKRPWLDAVMIFCARWLIGILSIIFILFIGNSAGWLSLFDDEFSLIFILFFGGFAVLNFIVSYLVATIWKHPRPIREFPETRVLIHTLGTWKSFPSDHTMIATLLSMGILGLVGAHSWLFIFFVCATLLVGVGRVYVGVHYPRDILGGLFIPIILFFVMIKVWQSIYFFPIILYFFK